MVSGNIAAWLETQDGSLTKMQLHSLASACRCARYPAMQRRSTSNNQPTDDSIPSAAAQQSHSALGLHAFTPPPLNRINFKLNGRRRVKETMENG